MSDGAGQALRQTLVCRQSLEGLVKEAQDPPEIGLDRHVRVRQMIALCVEEANANPLRGARGKYLNIQPYLLVVGAQASEACCGDEAPRKRHQLPVDGDVHIKRRAVPVSRRRPSCRTNEHRHGGELHDS